MTDLIRLSGKEQELFLCNLRAALSPSTFRAYSSEVKSFRRWCEGESVAAFPASAFTVARYIGQLRSTGRSFSSVRSFVSAVRLWHEAAGLASPTDDPQVRAAVKAAARSMGRAGHQKAALTIDLLTAILRSIPDDVRGRRDRAILAVGFMGGFRRAELAALSVSDLERKTDKRGLPLVLVTVRRSKTDPTGAGMVKALFSGRELNAVALLDEWLEVYEPAEDAPLFPSIRRGGHIQDRALSGGAVAKIVQDRAQGAGMRLDVAGHSLRRGFVTSAIEAGASERSVMNQTGHKSSSSLRKYIERHDAETDNAAALF